MQKLADGHDTAVGSSMPRPWSRFVAAPGAGAALDCEVVAGWPPTGEPALDRGVDDVPLHPLAAPMRRTDTQANASLSLPLR
jgi:hypothetical protein